MHLIQFIHSLLLLQSTSHMSTPHARSTMSLYNGHDNWSPNHHVPLYDSGDQYYTHDYRDCSYSPPQLPQLLDNNHGLVQVPQRQYQANIQRNHTSNIVPMKFVTARGCGIRLADVQARAATGLLHADDMPLQGFGMKVTYRIEWPGYDSYNKQKHALRATRLKQSVSLAKVATHVAEVMKDFINDMKEQPSAEPHWTVGPGGIDFDDLYLLEVRQVAKASLQPVIAYRPKVAMDSPMTSFTSYYPPPPMHTPNYHTVSHGHLHHWG
ncbi:hypothetical protein BDY19DRAFT_113380 [Irpex rosettiformis]|uniref:Uncharacterized protein n=1 Tax=Irpex rosettiformis TaxID=378272 RepID=A0ACB8U5G0_9APHY|nr:hypothetical protein BDY19DRAFT_113380 [Irpex rosettiformis]